MAMVELEGWVLGQLIGLGLVGGFALGIWTRVWAEAHRKAGAPVPEPEVPMDGERFGAALQALLGSDKLSSFFRLRSRMSPGVVAEHGLRPSEETGVWSVVLSVAHFCLPVLMVAAHLLQGEKLYITMFRDPKRISLYLQALADFATVHQRLIDQFADEVSKPPEAKAAPSDSWNPHG